MNKSKNKHERTKEQKVSQKHLNNYRNERRKYKEGVKVYILTTESIKRYKESKKDLVYSKKRLNEKVRSNLWNLKMTTHTHTDTLSRRFKEEEKHNKSSKK